MDGEVLRPLEAQYFCAPREFARHCAAVQDFFHLSRGCGSAAENRRIMEGGCTNHSKIPAHRNEAESDPIRLHHASKSLLKL